MIAKLRVAHKLLLIYLLSMVSVIYLVFSLIAEKNIAIAFAHKELRGNGYITVVRDALVEVASRWVGRLDDSAEEPGAAAASGDLDARIAAIVDGERRLGPGLGTEELARRAVAALEGTAELSPTDAAARAGPAYRQAIEELRALLGRVGDQSNLILDTDLDSFYTMSVMVVRMPQIVDFITQLSSAAHAMVAEGDQSTEAHARFLVIEGGLTAALADLGHDIEAGYRGDRSGELRANLDPAYRSARTAIEGFLRDLRPVALLNRSSAEDVQRLMAIRSAALSAAGSLWRQTGTEVERMLLRRIGRLQARLTTDLATAGLISLVVLLLILYVARQIAGPIRELAGVAEQVRTSSDYALRARGGSGGEIGTLVGGFNAMLDRLQTETAREQQRAESERERLATRLVDAVESLGEGFALYDADDRLIVCNEPYRRMNEVLADELKPGARWIDLMRLGLRRGQFADVAGREEAWLQELIRDRAHPGASSDVLLTTGQWLRAVDQRTREGGLVSVRADVTKEKTVAAEMARRAAMLEAIGHTASEIVAGIDWQRGIQDLLGRLGVAAEVSRATLFETHRDAAGRLVQSCRYDWAEPGLAAISGDARYQNMSLAGDHGEEVGEWTRRRQRGEVVQATRSQTSGYTREVFEEHGTLSFLSVPLMVSGEWWGFLGFDDCNIERAWADVEIDVLKIATALISGAIERARAEERLQLSEQRYALAARGANDGLWDWDIFADTAYFSPRLHEILGLPDGKLGTRPAALFDRVSRQDLPALQRGLDNRLARGRQKFEFECRMRHETGTEHWMAWRGLIVYGPDGPVRLVGSLHDIDERKTAEAMLRESETRFRALSDDAPVLLALMDVDDKLVFANQRFLEFCGHTLEQVARDGWREDVHPDDLPMVLRIMREAYDHRTTSEIEYRRRRHDGEYRWVHATQVARTELDGTFAGFVGALVDITDRKRAEAEVDRQREALHQSEKLTALGSLLAGVAHELNNPLSVVVGQAMLLEETAREQQVITRSETIRRAAERCSRIVRTFLSLARRRRPEQSRVQLNAVVEMAIELLAYQLRISDIALSLDLAADLPDLLADADQLHQVVTNLIVNAQQALADARQPRRLAIATRFDRSRQMARLSVADNGPGVPVDIRPRIFEPFFTTKPVGQGTGIGLAMCVNVIAVHKGTLQLEESAGGGATFVVELPAPQDGLPEQPAAPAATAAAPRAKLRILVVDDEVEIAETLREILAGTGHQVEVARDGQAALDRLAVASFDAILSDLRMPVLDGPGLYAALQTHYPQLARRIAFITGDTLSATLGKFLADTGALCLEKPFTPADIRRLIDQVMNQA